jgi:hypothetical protein
MKRRYEAGGEIDAMEEANNRTMFSPRKVSIGSADNEDENLKKRAMERSRIMQQEISSGSDFTGRPQDEGYRPNEGTARDRATLEGARDSGKITESGDQGFGGPGSSRVVKATPKATPKPKVTDTGDESARLLAKYKKPALRQETMNEKAKKFVEKREATKREKETTPARGRGGVAYAQGGMVSSASKRADGIATKGKTRCKIC